MTMSDLQYYREQAATAQQIAAAATLQNVRTRYLESAAVWTKIADQAERLGEMQSHTADNPDG